MFQGDCYAATGHDLDAIAAWQMALTAGVGEPVIYEQLVDALLRVGRPAEALDTLAEADLRWTDRRGFDARRGLALALLDRHQEALPLLEAAATDPAADRELLFYVMQAIYVGRLSGWLEPSEALRKRFDAFLERYTAAAGTHAALAKTWRRAVQER